MQKKSFLTNFFNKCLIFFSSIRDWKKKKILLTKVEKYGGSPRELSGSDLPTYADVARCFYAVSEKVKNFNNKLCKVRERVVKVWKKCKPHLPRIQEGAIYMELKRFLIFVRNFNRKQPKRRLNKYKMEKLFDISACSCDLPVVTCASVHSTGVNCQKKHILCYCEAEHRVPEEERAFLRSQRAQGTIQMDPVNRDGAIVTVDFIISRILHIVAVAF